jgi:mannosylglucosylglycerate synthase
VEAVMLAHARLLVAAGVRVGVVAGRGAQEALPKETRLHLVPEIDSQHPAVLEMNKTLEQGQAPENFDAMVDVLAQELTQALAGYDRLIVHNVFTKHFNLPLTAALFKLLKNDLLPPCVAWCHDFTWTSPSSRSKVFPGYPWDLLRSRAPGVHYVVVSKRRQAALAELLEVSLQEVRVVYNGVSAQGLLGISAEGDALAKRLGLYASDLILLMPVRVTQAKNIEFAMRVTASLKRSFPRVRLVITGPPDPHSAASMAYFDELRMLRRELDVEDAVRFVFESGPDAAEGLYIDETVVGDLYRMADVMFMPSHREGFGMPVVEAGLAGVPVVATNVPAAEEIGGDNVLILSSAASAETAAMEMLSMLEENPISVMRRMVRRRYTWQQIFRLDILPLLDAAGKRRAS